ncbi:sodium channel protein 60E isoform X2 [Daphnia magna]|uniref:sodium channel protein 60E isoform X2 n=1 Tax=Daphnia magna TaxID=35525 RepID=UPI001E1BB2A4|nr:sodium channel protein 60E isoform X2 [Daphnia magna]
MPVVAPPPPAAAVTGRRTCSFEEPASDRHHLKPSSGGGGGGDVRTRSPSVAGRVSVCDVVANSSATGQSGEPANRNRMPSGGGGGVGCVSVGGSVGGTTGAGGLRQSRQQSVESRGSSSIPTATLLAGHHRQVVAGGASGGGGGGSSSNGNSISKTGPIEDGAPLPAAFEPVPLNLYGKPLQEIDPTVRDKTFVVVSNRFRKNYIHRFSASRSCFLFSPWNPLRRIAIYLSTHPYFDYVVMTTILLNCIFLAMTEPVEQAEYVFLGIYSCEMVIKAVAKGLVLDRLTYLRSPWNWLDFVVILSGYATLAVEIGNLAGLRTFRVLRALKTVSIIPGLRTIINALLKAMRQLMEVMMLIVFCLSVLALFALQVFMGELRNKCIRHWDPNATQLNWHTWIREEENWLREETGSFRLCGNLTGTWHCPSDHVCLPGLGNNPNFGYTNFDTFPWSMLTTFQLITLDYWENIYNMVLAVCGPYTIVFFMIVVFFGAFYLINLMLAVVAMSYDDEAGSNNQEKIKTLTDYREESTFSFDPGKLPLVLLEKGHHADQARQKKARMDARMLANRNHLSGISGMMDEDDQSPPRQHPHVADLVWALAKSEAAKLEAAKREVSCHKLDAASGDGPPLVISVHQTATTPPPPPLMEVAKVKTTPNERRRRPAVVTTVAKEEEEEEPMSFNLDMTQFNCPPPQQQQQQQQQNCVYDAANVNPIKHCDIDPLADGCVLFQSTHFASSFNTDVGYSSETSRAPSYPSSVVFKRRTYTTNKSISQNYSSLTESIGSQPACDLATLEGGLMERSGRSPATTDKAASLPSNGSDPRRLSYKRACDPDKRFSLGFDSMTRLSACDSAHDLSVNSAGVLIGGSQQQVLTAAKVDDSKRKGKEERRLQKSRQPSNDPSCSSSTSSGRHHHHQHGTEATETDDRWLKRRQSYQKSSKGNHNHRMNHLGHQEAPPIGEQNGARPDEPAIFSLECYLTWLRTLRSILQRVIQSPWIDFVITISIVLNTAFLAAEHHGMSPDVKHVLDVGNKVFTSVFTTECILKMGALGTDFFRNGWNVFDFVIVLASLVDLGLEIVNGLSVLRGMRLMRVLRLAQSWTTMRVLLSIILSSLGALANLTFVLAIVVYIFAVIGMQLFGRDYTPENFYPDPVPRWNFKDFFHSFMMIFRILCGEWAEPLWDCMRAERKYGSEICFSIFLPALVMGNFLVLNLFLALLLNSFSCEELKSRKEEINEDSKLVEGLRKIRTIAKATRTLVNLNSFERSESVASKRIQLASRSPSCVALAHNRLATPNANINVSPSRARSAAAGAVSLACSFDDSVSVQLRSVYGSAEHQQQRAVWPSETKLEASGSQQPPFVVQETQKDADEVEFQEPIVHEPHHHHHHHHHRSGADNIADWSILIPTVLEVVPPIEAAKLAREDTHSIVLSGQEEMPEEPPDCIPSSFHDKCCCCWRNPGCSWLATPLCRRWVAGRTALLRVVKHPAFEWSILILIFGSSITLCFEDIYLEQNPYLMNILRWTNMAFAILFALEMIIKWFALGLKYYFSSVWTALDFVIVTVSVISVAVEDSANLSALRSLRTLRALRPLRAISRWQGMKIVVNALMFAIPAIFNVLLVCLVFWLVFSILGVQLFGGKFYKCIDDETGERYSPQLIDTKVDCLSRNLTWTNSPIHFDHVGHAYLALFQVATFEGWMEIMADAVDVRGVDLQPSYEANLWAYLYFVVFIVCGAFFTLNLFIGVIIDNFNMLKKRYEGGVLEMFLTESQKHYYTAMKKLGRKKPRKMIRRPMNPYLALFYDIAMSRRFEIAIFIMIFLNMVVMGVEHYGQPPVFTFILELCNALFTTMFALEAVVKMIGLRHHYFTLPWNLFDLCLVSCSVVGLIMEDVLNEFPISPTLLRVVRVFRLGRVLRLVKAAKGIRKLLFALIVSLPALFNIGALLALITFIYAIIGMALFGHVTHSGAINEMVNFETFGRSMLLLFRLMTGAGWNDILNPLLIQPPYCDITYHNLPYGNCGSPILATLYLVSFIVLSSMIVINMYIAVLLENFNQAHHEEELGLGEEDLERFYAKWSRFDPYATQFIAFGELSDFVASLDPPLGISRPNMAALVNLDILIASGDRLHCLDILHALTRRVLGDVEDTEHFRKLQEQMDEKFKKQFPNRRELEIVSSTAKWKQRDTAARVIQRAYQLFLRRKLLARKRMEEMRGHVQTQTSFSIDSTDSSFAYEPDRLSLRSVLNRMSSLFHTYLGGGGLSRQSSSRYGDSPSPIGSVASGGGQASRQNSTRRRLGSGAHPPKSRPHSTLLDVLVPGSRRSSIWSLGTMVVSAQVHNECSNGQNHQPQSNGQTTSCGNRRASLAMAASPPDNHADGGMTLRHGEVFPPQSSSSSSTTGDNGGPFLSPPQQRSDVIVKLTAASLDSDLNM